MNRPKEILLVRRARFAATAGLLIVAGLAVAAGRVYADSDPPPPDTGGSGHTGTLVAGGLVVVAVVFFSWLVLHRIATRRAARRIEEQDNDG